MMPKISKLTRMVIVSYTCLNLALGSLIFNYLNGSTIIVHKYTVLKCITSLYNTLPKSELQRIQTIIKKSVRTDYISAYASK